MKRQSLNLLIKLTTKAQQTMKNANCDVSVGVKVVKLQNPLVSLLVTLLFALLPNVNWIMYKKDEHLPSHVFLNQPGKRSTNLHNKRISSCRHLNHSILVVCAYTVFMYNFCAV